jgi:phosphoglycerol transferase MdoB-like AlkP superfamily enzyme
MKAKQRVSSILLFATALVLFASALSVERLYFFLLYRSLFDGTAFYLLLVAFIKGFRFDIATSAEISAVLFGLLFFPGLSGRIRFRKGVLVLLGFWYSLLLVVNFADIRFFGFSQRHMTYEILDAWQDAGSIVLTGLTKFLPESCLVLIFSFCFFLLFLTLTRRFLLLSENKSEKLDGFFLALAKDTAVFLLIMALTTVLAVGGYRKKPLAVINAFDSDHVQLGNLSLNGIFTSINSIYKRDPVTVSSMAYLKNMSFSEQDQKEVMGFLITQKEEYDRKYPLFRRYVYQPAERRRLNVVILIMESWSAKFIGSLDGRPAVTPFFDELSQKGLLLTNCFANGDRSIPGISAIVGSMPIWGTITYREGGILAQTDFESAVSVFKENGYQTVFIHGAKRTSMGLDGLVKRLGIERHLAKDDLLRTSTESDGVWGLYDEFTFARAHEEFERMKQPFFAVVFSLSSHTPYNIPSTKYEKFDRFTPHSAFLNSMYYSDCALRRFFERAQKSAYFNNTLFVIVGDHTEGKSTRDNMYNAYHIPCLFYSPALITPGRLSAVTSQVDIIPTIFDLLRFSDPFNSLGKSVFSTEKRRAFFPDWIRYCWTNDRYLLLTDLQMPVALFDYRSNPSINLLINWNPVVQSKAEELQRELRAYLKLDYDLVMQKRMRPPRPISSRAQ